MIVNTIGILQGRLSPQPEHETRFQFFPENWLAELQRAQSMGFDCVEWLFDWDKWESNPLMRLHPYSFSESKTYAMNLDIVSVCADYFMKYPLIGDTADESSDILGRLMNRAYNCSQNLILVPFLEDGALKTQEDKQTAFLAIKKALYIARDCGGMRLALETELPVDELIDFVDRFDDPRVGVYYDIGNATSYGFDCELELELLRSMVYGVHIKDRKEGSSQSVYLGEGDADFRGCFRALSHSGYQGSLILQAFRGDDYIEDAQRQLAFVRESLAHVM